MSEHHKDRQMDWEADPVLCACGFSFLTEEEWGDHARPYLHQLADPYRAARMGWAHTAFRRLSP